MQEVFFGVAAAFIGVFLGFWLRGSSAKADRAERDRRIQQLGDEAAAVRADLARSQSESAARAGFEPLAAERERSIGQLLVERDSLRGELQTRGAAESQSAARISQLEAELRSERQSLAEKIALLEAAKETLSNQFKTLAGDILAEKSKNLSEGSQKELGMLLTPLRNDIEAFRKKVEESQTDSKTGVTRLEALIGNLGGLNVQLAEEARNLTTALRGSAKAQGDWGEFILRNLLEKAGLREGDQFTFQQVFAGLAAEEGDRTRIARTDVIVRLPGGRSLIIDSKVSLNAYTDCVNAEDEDARKAALRLHLASVRAHAAGLAKAAYHLLPGIESPDFVVLFVPIEPAFSLALQHDADLWTESYRQGILFAGPTTLLYVIRIVNMLWQQELQARSVQDVMSRGAELYDKFVNFVADLEAVGKSLRTADASYTNAMKKLSEGRGNLVRQVEMLRGLGVRTAKQLPRNLLDAAGVDEAGASELGANDPGANESGANESGLALAAQSDE
jgi:DNA recombination protein RmuC